jgi:hypothetical protein
LSNMTISADREGPEPLRSLGGDVKQPAKDGQSAGEAGIAETVQHQRAALSLRAQWRYRPQLVDTVTIAGLLLSIILLPISPAAAMPRVLSSYHSADRSRQRSKPIR